MFNEELLHNALGIVVRQTLELWTEQPVPHSAAKYTYKDFDVLVVRHSKEQENVA